VRSWAGGVGSGWGAMGGGDVSSTRDLEAIKFHVMQIKII
jgi:hypothetical protein